MEHFEANQALKDVLEKIEYVRRVVVPRISHKGIHMSDWPSFNEDDDLSGQQKLAAALADLDIRDGDDGRITRPYPGVIEVHQEDLEAFCELNASKDNFKSVMARLKKESATSYRRYVEFLKKGPQTRDERYPISFGRLSINHLERKFAILDERPKSVSYCWSSRSVSIVKINKRSAIEIIESLEDTLPFHLQQQRTKLASLPDQEQLARAVPQSAGMKANIVFSNGEPKTIKYGLPILVPEGGEVIRMKFLNESDLSQKNVQSRLSRDDKKLEDQAIAPSIHVYRYKEDYRAHE